MKLRQRFARRVLGALARAEVAQGQEIVLEREITDGNGNVKKRGVVAVGHENPVKGLLLRWDYGVRGAVR